MKTRFAPSPTGHLHIGGARTALFNWLLARHNQGSFVLRIEDTDATRSDEEYTKDILSSIHWLGLDYDGEVEYQSHRLDVYEEYKKRLIECGAAYYCHCSPERLDEIRKQALITKAKPRYDGHCRELSLGPAPGAVIRFKCPTLGETAWKDLIKGPISFLNSELDDLVLFRSDGLPTYNMAVVADDASMGISHVVRGDDHVNNTPRQILLYEALNAELPEFAHVPMILGGDKKRLSKRHGATSVLAYREMGYLPQALVNYLARLGWSHGDQEIFSLREMVELFNLSQVGRSAAVFNEEKLNWLNSHYLKLLSDEDLGEMLSYFLEKLNLDVSDKTLLAKAAGTVKERAKTLGEMAQKAAFYFVDAPVLNPKDATKLLTVNGKNYIKDFLQNVDSIKSHEDFDRYLSDASLKEGVKKGAVAQPIRLALTGETASPGLYEIIEILGADKVKKRLALALEHENS
ncbi:MAG: glutamate--tRNA ligase [Deltaproteobacteria bacterium]|jgi:glutamyl-tRNA synthetase|nr:glutamate--tRNA ligase [Deltaproteobacteria bacterium]